MDVTFHDTKEFEKWLRRLDQAAAGRIAGKLAFVSSSDGIRVEMPLVRFLGAGLHELRVSKFRVYFVYGPETLHVLAQGEKDTQVRDIARARRRIS